MGELFTVRVTVRGYEVDTQGHLNQAVYLLYCEHARWESMRAAGISQEELIRSGGGPAVLENTMRYHRELRAGDEVDVTCDWLWGTGKTFRVEQQITRTDGVLAAELSSVVGVIDFGERKLVADAAGHFRALAKHPEVLGF